jgi:hypothetical protein
VLQDPYIKLTLHDGRFDEGGKHRGESVKTKTKDNAGGEATFNETFQLNKPGLSKCVLVFQNRWKLGMSDLIKDKS